MASFLYYKPGDAPSRAFLERIEFPHVAHAGTPGRGCSTGPDGKAGFCFGLCPPPHPEGVGAIVGYFPAQQTWRRYVGGELWLGWETANPPRPEDLQLRNYVDGHPVTLADGHVWVIPPLIHADGTPNFETVIDWDEDGEIADRVRAADRPLWSLVEEFAFHSERFTDPKRERELYSVVAHAIGRNYRLSLWECGPLGILNTQGLARILSAILDCQIPDAVTV